MTLLDNYQLDDRYRSNEGRVYLTGIQALARIPIQQLRIDRVAGLNTAVFTSGYPGSPVGGFDLEMARVATLLPDLPIFNRPALNEELGATAVMGSQLASEQSDFRFDGILGIWYGKAPGLDRAGDALRHAVFAGTSRHGGAIAIVGDDPIAKSSTLPSSSDAALVDLHMPILYPGDVQETLDLGMHAVMLSRLTGTWAALKIVTNVADGTSTVDLSPGRTATVIPDLEIDGRPHVHRPSGNLITPYTLEMERDFKEVRSELARRYTVANRLNRVTVDPPDAWIGLISSGFTYHELLHALRRIGLTTPAEIAAAGIRIMHMQAPVPFDPATVKNFARGLNEIVVVEEKNPTLEWLVKDALYGGPDQPRVVGKTHPDGRTLMPSYGILDADTIMGGLHERLSARIEGTLAPLPDPPRERLLIPLTDTRHPFFCSGCPHNWGTRVPDGTLVGAGIGCSGMSMLMDESRVGDKAGVAAMGNEGTQWIGMSPFVERDHFTQNLGDGTFFHSGQLAIQAAVSAGVSMTYKLLFNGTVAMTGGQTTPNVVGVPEIATTLMAFGVSRVLVTTDDVSRYHGIDMPASVDVWDRTRIIEAQELLAGINGVTVLIHDQACAAQKRRFRRLGLAETPGFRVVINHRICEACGDCGLVSNCLSLHTVDTPLGKKTSVDQSSCNLDSSCLEGDCPSFMTVAVQAGSPDKGTATSPTGDDLPDPTPLTDTDIFDLRLAGIGGTGVVTAAQLLGTAAMLDGVDVRGLDQTGLSQKAGPVVSDLRLSRSTEMSSNLLGRGEADVILAFDLLVAADYRALAGATKEHTVVVASTTSTPTGAMVGHPESEGPSVVELIARLDDNTRAGSNRFVDAGSITLGLLGSSEQANVFILGVAVQAGLIPVTPAALERAITLNGVAVDANLAAFRWGRAWTLDPERVEASTSPTSTGRTLMELPELPDSLRAAVSSQIGDTVLTGVIEALAADLVGYQDRKCAADFVETVGFVCAAEQQVAPGSTRLTEAMARGLHKLTAYKDEYEVARLLSGSDSRALIEAVGGQGAKATWHLHPPLLQALGVGRKLRIPSNLGRPVMALLRLGRHLRGTPIDPFGRTRVRRLERMMLGEYQLAIATVVDSLSAENLDEAVNMATSAMEVRGFEGLKLQRGEAFLEDLRRYLAGATN